MSRLSHTVFIACRAEELWAALTEGEQTRHWYLGAAVESDFEVGGDIVFYAETGPDDGDSPPRKEAIRGQIRELISERSLAHSFRFSDLDEPETALRWTVEAIPGSPRVQRLDLVHDLGDLSEDSETSRRAGFGWFMALSALKTWLETGSALQLNGVSG